MKFKFNLKVSKVLDYLKFPRVYYYNEDPKDEDEVLMNLITKPDYKQFVEDMILKLKPFETIINKFYSHDFYSNYDYAGILMHACPPFEFEDINNYFDHLLKIDDKVFRNKIIESLLTIDDRSSKKKVVVDEQNAMEFINGLKIDSASKWHMLMIVQNPKSYLTDFMELLKKVEPYFNSYYDKYVEQVQNVGVDLVKKLDVNPNQVFSEMTYQAIAYDFSDYDICYVYVSAVFPYTLNFMDKDDCRFIWGMEMHHAFEKLHAHNDDKTTQRVKVFKALGDKTRYEALKLLAKGVTSIKDIASELDVSSATISYHINEFLTSGIITVNKDQRQKTGYVVDYNRLEEVILDLKMDLNFPE